MKCKREYVKLLWTDFTCCAESLKIIYFYTVTVYKNMNLSTKQIAVARQGRR